MNSRAESLALGHFRWFSRSLLLGATGCTQVDAGNLGVVTKWGEIQDTALQEGIHFRTPVKTQIINISTRVHKMEASATASSKDLAGRVDEDRTELSPRRGTASSRSFETSARVWSSRTRSSIPRSRSRSRKPTAQYTAEELDHETPTGQRDARRTASRLTLKKSNVLVTELSITDFQFDPQYQQAVEAKQVAEQRALTARNDLARIKVEAEQAEAQAHAARRACDARESRSRGERPRSFSARRSARRSSISARSRSGTGSSPPSSVKVRCNSRPRRDLKKAAGR